MAAKAKLVWDGRVLESKLAQGSSKANAYLAKTTQFYSLQTEGKARREAKWTDRSSNARNGLTGSYVARIGLESSSFQIDLFHKVNYGIWLEIRFKQKYAIIKKTLDKTGPKFFDAANKLIQKMFS